MKLLILDRLRNKSLKIKNKSQKIFSVTSLIVFTLAASGAQAATPSEKLNSINSQLNNARSELSRLSGEKTSLNNEIARLDAKIREIQLSIDQANAQIEIKTNEINDTNRKIAEKEAEIKTQREILNEYLREMYLDGQVSLAEQLIKSDSFSDFVDQNEYMSTMQSKVKEVTDKIVALKNELESKRAQLEVDKKEIEKLKADQVSKKSEIDVQKAAKEQLLASVQNDENKYQSFVGNLQRQQQAAQAEMARLASAASTPRGLFGGSYKSYGRVNRGDIIGYQGNSGYSTGTHMHFEVRSGGGDINPLPLINSGAIGHPIPGARITQYWGEIGNLSGYVRHTGIDYSNGFGAPIYAASNGEIIARVTGMGNTYPGGVNYGNYVMVRHDNGLVSIYAHLR